MSQILVIVFLALYGTTLTSALVCPPAAELSPCSCDEVNLVITCRNIPGRFDIKAVFDRVTPLIDELTIFNELFIMETSLFEIPDNSITALKFKAIKINYNLGLDWISPRAFNATYAITEDLSLWNNALIDAAPGEDIFTFFNKFSKVSKIWLPGNRLTTIPSHAFQLNQNLKQLYFGGNRISHIGGYAFTALMNLEKLWLSHNKLNPTNTSVEAFKSVSSKLDVDLSSNTDFSYLEEAIFKPLLDSALKVEVGASYCGPNGCRYVYLDCDSRADWICANVDNYRDKLIGFRCSGGLYPTVFEYCADLGLEKHTGN